MGFVKTARNDLKKFRFFEENWPKENIRQKLSQHTAQVVFHRIEQKKVFPSPLYLWDKKI